MGDDATPLVPDRRITDAERNAVMARLRAATVEGSLDLDELGARIDQVFQARTAGELAAVTHDLPEPQAPPAAPTRPPPRRRSILRNLEFRIHAATWCLTNGFLTGIWAVSGGGHFWPFYPAAGWGIALGLHALAATAEEQKRAERADPDRPRHRDERRAERQRWKDAQRAARQELVEASQEAAIDLQRKAARAVRQLSTPGRPPGPPQRPGGPWAPPPSPQGRDGWRGAAAGESAAGSTNGASRSVARVVALYVDIVGSTQLTTAMGDETWTAVRARYRSMVGRCLTEHGGSEANVAGDGILARFDGETSAVRCAIGIQRELAVQRAETGFAPRVRVAIHTGGAVSEGADLVGHVINLVCRICDEAEPDEILVSEAVAEKLEGRFDLEGRGLRTLKGISQPRHLLAVGWQ